MESLATSAFCSMSDLKTMALRLCSVISVMLQLLLLQLQSRYHELQALAAPGACCDSGGVLLLPSRLKRPKAEWGCEWL